MVLLWIDRLPGMVSSARVQLLASMSGKFRSKVGLLANDAALKRAVRFLVVASLFFAVSHQAMNLIAVRQTFGAFTSATSSMAEWLRENIDTNQQAIVLTNFLQGWDIPLMTDGAVQNYAFLGPDSWPFREEVIDDRLALDNLIYSASSPGRKIFYLLETSPAEFPLKYDISPPGKLEARTTFSLNGDYPVIDPLAALSPRTYWQFPGPPDLLHYATLQSGPGYRQVGATYTLSEVVALVLYDDDESVWATENGASSSSGRSLVEIGKSSLEVTWETLALLFTTISPWVEIGLS